jgi:hypothetical protein
MFLTVGGGCFRISSSGTSQGPAIDVSTSVVAAAGPATSTPQGPTIDVFNFDGTRCRNCSQHPQGARHQRLRLRWWSRHFLALMVGAPEPSAPTPPGGPLSIFLSVDGGCSSTSSSGPSWGPAINCRVMFKTTEQGAEELASPAGSHPLPRWARGPLSVP